MRRRGSILVMSLVVLGSLAWGQVGNGTQGGAGSVEDTTTATTTTTTTTYNTNTESSDRADRGAIGFGPIVGFYRSNDGDAMRLTGGAALRLKLGPALGLEGSITYREDRFADGAVTARSWPIMVTGLIYPLPIVYGAVGAGWFNTTLETNTAAVAPTLPSITGSETQQRFGWHFGGGVEVPLGALSLTGDIRYVFLDYDWKNVPGTSGTNANFYVISAGLLFGL